MIFKNTLFDFHLHGYKNVFGLLLLTTVNTATRIGVLYVIIRTVMTAVNHGSF